MTRRNKTRWIIASVGAAVLLAALAMPASADPPQDARPGGSGSSPATAIALCCTWGNGITDGITYSISAPDAATADAIDAGVQEWATAINAADLHFYRVTSGAEVTIRYKPGGGTIAGSTSRSTSGGYITGASMSISGKAFGTTNTAAQLTTVTAHEWGHVLGLNHANGTGLLMSPVLDPNVTTIQQCDLDAAKTVLAWFVPTNTGTLPASLPASYTCP